MFPSSTHESAYNAWLRELRISHKNNHHLESLPSEGLYDSSSDVSNTDISDMPSSYSPGTAADNSKRHGTPGMLYGLVLLATSRRGHKAF